MGNAIDLSGKRFDRLVVIERITNGDKNHTYWKCLCNCGNETIARSDALKDGNKKSCGCYHDEMAGKRISQLKTKHGMHNTRLYVVWNSMCARCGTKTNKNYKNYGARGISVCKEWRDDFQNFYEWAINNGYKSDAPKGGCTIDRIDNDKGYSPDNCRFVDMSVQCFNQRQRRSKSGFRGISYNEKTMKYRVCITKDHRTIEVGTYSKVEDAIKARRDAEIDLYGMVISV